MLVTRVKAGNIWKVLSRVADAEHIQKHELIIITTNRIRRSNLDKGRFGFPLTSSWLSVGFPRKTAPLASLHLGKCRSLSRGLCAPPSCLPDSLSPLPVTLTTHQPHRSSVESLDTRRGNVPTLGLDTCCCLRPEPFHSLVLMAILLLLHILVCSGCCDKLLKMERLRKNNSLFHLVLEAGRPRSTCWRIWGLMSTQLPTQDGRDHTTSSHGGRDKGTRWGL